MKKTCIFLLFFLCLTAFALPQKKKTKKTKQKENIVKIEYQTFTRRGRTEIIITKDSAISIGRTEKKFILLPTDKWKEITATLTTIQLSSVPSLPSSTKKRATDAASHCKIIISTKTNQYESQYFDGGKPMKALAPLYDAIKDLRNTIDSAGKIYGE